MGNPHLLHHTPKWASANRQKTMKKRKKEKNICGSKIKEKNTTRKREAVLTPTGAKEDVVTPKNNNDNDEDNDDDEDESPKKCKVLQPPTNMRI
eukprot:14461359-Ditylum_brightwellii.AAC.1